MSSAYVDPRNGGLRSTATTHFFVAAGGGDPLAVVEARSCILGASFEAGRRVVGPSWARVGGQEVVAWPVGVGPGPEARRLGAPDPARGVIVRVAPSVGLVHVCWLGVSGRLGAALRR